MVLITETLSMAILRRNRFEHTHTPILSPNIIYHASQNNLIRFNCHPGTRLAAHTTARKKVLIDFFSKYFCFIF